MSVVVAPFDWASKKEYYTALTFFSVIWITIGAPLPIYAISSLMTKGFYPASFLDFPSLCFNYFLMLVIILTLVAYLQLSKKGFYYALSVMSLSLMNVGAAWLLFIPGVVSLNEVKDSLGQFFFIYALAIILTVASLADFAVGFMVYQEDKKLSILKHILNVIQMKGSVRYLDLRKDLGIQEPALSEAINTLLNKGELSVKTEKGENYFILNKENQGEGIRD